MRPGRRSRVLVAGGPYRNLTAQHAAVAIGRGFAPTFDVAVVGLAGGGSAFGAALAELDVGTLTAGDDGWLARGSDWLVAGIDPQPGGDPFTASSRAAGDWLAGALVGASAPSRVLVDLTSVDCHDAGAGLLAGLGATADVPLDQGAESLAAITRLDLTAVRHRLDGAELIGVIRYAERDDHLLGLRGITSRLGRARGLDPSRMLAIDEALGRFARLADSAAAEQPGSGASGGAGFAVRALGGRLATGPSVLFDRSGIDRTVAAADLVVTVCDSFDFGSRGGAAVIELARLCEAAERPLMVLADVLAVSGREMRTFGIEAAQLVRDLGIRDEAFGDIGMADLAGGSAESLTAAAARMASGWHGGSLVE